MLRCMPFPSFYDVIRPILLFFWAHVWKHVGDVNLVALAVLVITDSFYGSRMLLYFRVAVCLTYILLLRLVRGPVPFESVRQMMCHKNVVLEIFKTQILTTKISKSIRRHSATNIFKKAECSWCHRCLRVVHPVVTPWKYLIWLAGNLAFFEVVSVFS